MRPRSYERIPTTFITCHFSYISPILIKPAKGIIGPPQEKENTKLALERALPTLVACPGRPVEDQSCRQYDFRQRLDEGL